MFVVIHTGIACITTNRRGLHPSGDAEGSIEEHRPEDDHAHWNAVFREKDTLKGGLRCA